jgi:hypothetical protein
MQNSVLTSQKTLCRHYKDHLVNAVEENGHFYSENHITAINNILGRVSGVNGGQTADVGCQNMLDVQ